MSFEATSTTAPREPIPTPADVFNTMNSRSRAERRQAVRDGLASAFPWHITRSVIEVLGVESEHAEGLLGIFGESRANLKVVGRTALGLIWSGLKKSTESPRDALHAASAELPVNDPLVVLVRSVKLIPAEKGIYVVGATCVPCDDKRSLTEGLEQFLSALGVAEPAEAVAELPEPELRLGITGGQPGRRAGELEGVLGGLLLCLGPMALKRA